MAASTFSCAVLCRMCAFHSHTFIHGKMCTQIYINIHITHTQARLYCHSYSLFEVPDVSLTPAIFLVLTLALRSNTYLDVCVCMSGYDGPQQHENLYSRELKKKNWSLEIHTI